MHRRHLIAASAALAFPLLGRAQAWPAKPIRVVVPFTPGGTTDFVTRLVMVEVAKSLGQTIVVENKPGAGTVIGVDSVAKSAPDGHAFVTVANSFTVNQTLVKKLPYDTLKDLRPVALMGLSEHVLATHPASGLKTVADIVRQAKAGQKLSYASFGNGTSAHLAGEMLKSQLGIDIVHVPYKGQAPALADLLGGQVSMMFGNWPEFRGHVQSGKLVAIGMATAQRSVYAPGIPTLAEQGVKIESNSWNGLLAPAATPDAIVQRMLVPAQTPDAVVEAFNRELNAAIGASVVNHVLLAAGVRPEPGTPARLREAMQDEVTLFRVQSRALAARNSAPARKS